jgi:hypothetical protein
MGARRYLDVAHPAYGSGRRPGPAHEQWAGRGRTRDWRRGTGSQGGFDGRARGRGRRRRARNCARALRQRECAEAAHVASWPVQCFRAAAGGTAAAARVTGAGVRAARGVRPVSVPRGTRKSRDTPSSPGDPRSSSTLTGCFDNGSLRRSPTGGRRRPSCARSTWNVWQASAHGPDFASLSVTQRGAARARVTGGP